MDSPLKRARKAASQTAVDVAHAVGIDQSHYTRIENGDKGASPEVAAKLAAHFPGLTELEILYPQRYIAQESAA